MYYAIGLPSQLRDAVLSYADSKENSHGSSHQSDVTRDYKMQEYLQKPTTNVNLDESDSRLINIARTVTQNRQQDRVSIGVRSPSSLSAAAPFLTSIDSNRYWISSGSYQNHYLLSIDPKILQICITAVLEMPLTKQLIQGKMKPPYLVMSYSLNWLHRRLLFKFKRPLRVPTKRGKLLLAFYLRDRPDLPPLGLSEIRKNCDGIQVLKDVENGQLYTTSHYFKLFVAYQNAPNCNCLPISIDNLVLSSWVTEEVADILMSLVVTWADSIHN